MASLGLGRYGIWLRVVFAVAVVAFGGYFSMIALGDLVPLEQFGADFSNASGTTSLHDIAPGSPAARAGLVDGDELLTIENRPVHSTLDWASVFARVEEGRPVTVAIARGGRVERHAVTFERRGEAPWSTREGFVLLLSRFAQLVTLIFAVSLASRAADASARLGAWLLAALSVYTVGLPPRMAVWWRDLPFPIELLFYWPSISKVLIGLILFAFFCSLLKVPLRGRRAVLLGVPAVTFALWDISFISALLYHPEFLPSLTGFLPAIIVVNFGYVLAALVMLGVHYRTLIDPTDRRRLRWILAGSVLGCAAGVPTVAGLWLGVGDDPTLIYHSPFGLQLAYTAFLVMPASFWWAIARGELFDLRFVVRRGLQYVFARRGLLVMTPLAVAALVGEAALHDQQPFRETLRTHAWLYYGVAATLIVFRRRRASWLEALDRRLFRERYDAVRLLRDVVAQVRTSSDPRTAADSAVKQIDAALHPEWLAVYQGGDGDQSLTLLAGETTVLSWPGRSQLMEVLRVHQKPLDVFTAHGSWLSHRLSHEDLEFLTYTHVRLIVPARMDGAGDVIFALGAKRSGEPYSEEDKNLVHAVAESVAHLVAVLARDSDAADASSSSWDKHLWGLADAVARGSRVDWTAESTEVVADERRQTLLELQALERLMQVHGTAPDGAADAETMWSRWGDFELRERIGAGRFGTVYRAWDPKLERDVAIKLLDVAGVDRAAYLREARHLARVRHPNVVHVYGADERDDISGFWMELIQGRTLGEELRERGPFEVEDLAAVGNVLCRALSAVHRAGLVHQDVKAQNVMREPDGRLVLMDLGSVSVGANRPYWGTPRYMAPELFRGGIASPGSDIYSLGVLLFLLATGEFPVDGKTFEEIAERHTRGDIRRVRDLRADLPNAVLEAIERGMHADPFRRFSSSDEMSAAMSAVRVA